MSVQLRSQLERIYAKFPTLIPNTDRGVIEQAASEVLPPGELKAFKAALQDTATFSQVRRAIVELDPALKTPPNKRLTTVISGGGIGGPTFAIALARMGWSVKLVELRPEDSRWNPLLVRESMVQMLNGLMPGAGDKLLQKVHPITAFERTDATVVDPQTGKAQVTINKAGRFAVADELLAPHDVKGAWREVSGAQIETAEWQTALYEIIDEISAADKAAGMPPRIEVLRGRKLEAGERDENGRWSVSASDPKNPGAPPLSFDGVDLLIGAEGAGSSLRNDQNLAFIPTSPQTSYILGRFQTRGGDNPDIFHAYYGRLPGLDVPFRVAAHDASTSSQHGLVVAAEVPPGVNLLPDPKKFQAGTPGFKAEKAKLEEAWLRQQATFVLPDVDLSDAPLDKSTGAFPVQQAIIGEFAKTQIAFTGDSVEKDSFIPGGGAMTAAVPDVAAVMRLAHAIQKDGSIEGRKQAFTVFEHEVKLAAIERGYRGFADFFPNDGQFGNARELWDQFGPTYRQMMDDWLGGKGPSPDKVLPELVKRFSVANPPLDAP